MLTDSAQSVSLEEVNKLVKSTNQGFNAILEHIHILDKNVLSDMTHLATQQNMMMDELCNIRDILLAVPVAIPVAEVAKKSKFKISKFKLALGVGIVVLVVAKNNKSKKES